MKDALLAPSRFYKPGLLLSLLLAYSSLTLALPEDREKPVQVQSERMQWNNQQQLATYTGQVEVTQGELKIKAELLELHRGEDGALERATASSPGELAYMRDRPRAEEPKVEAWAETIDYQPAQDRVVLTGNARLVQGEDSFRGHRLTYNLLSQDIQAEQAESDAGRVEVILTPRRREATIQPEGNQQ
ncbi:lipopolysaccharide transport periplasmic protein LptA [Marinospirillum alkaliphilum]|uniref:Lipopolysaccharide export system protein LptA n=1 Tax=Marinospirillum alkaliphilum DSM 21637 TaxID=1122209 RepID=A0A1K1TP54_9GAMM|nr:lipopolysaccharide transport periplasmic protein LptA [Marinospirillum alkaliphilum]SFX02140.1 lipopolysaccharide export system protein LptA [Marinospirillum alkaliphilum DSM 21637]